MIKFQVNTFIGSFNWEPKKPREALEALLDCYEFGVIIKTVGTYQESVTFSIKEGFTSSIINNEDFEEGYDEVLEDIYLSIEEILEWMKNPEPQFDQ